MEIIGILLFWVAACALIERLPGIPCLPLYAALGGLHLMFETYHINLTLTILVGVLAIPVFIFKFKKPVVLLPFWAILFCLHMAGVDMWLYQVWPLLWSAVVWIWYTFWNLVYSILMALFYRGP